MKLDRPRLLAMLFPAVALALVLVLSLGLTWALLDAEGRAGLNGALAARGVVIAAVWAMASGAAAVAVNRLYDRFVMGPLRLATRTRVLLSDPDAPRLVGHGPSAVLAEAINGLADDRRTLRAEMAEQVEAASRRVAEQRDQLAALMNELGSAVVVCNTAGQVLLYNGRAVELSQRLSQEGQAAAKLGLGRSIYGLVDQNHIQHALDSLNRRIARHDDAPVPPAKFFAVTPSGRLLDVSLAAIRHQVPGEDESVTGYLLMLDDVTSEQEEHSRLDGVLLRMTESSRAVIANMQAALEMLEFPDLDPADHDRFLKVVSNEVGVMTEKLAELTEASSQDAITRWPLQEILGSDLVTAAARHIEATTGQSVASDEVDHELWLRVDSFGMMQVLGFLAKRLSGMVPNPLLWLRLSPAGARAHLDLGWIQPRDGSGPKPAELTRLQSEAIPLEGTPVELTVRLVVERHGGEVWLDRGSGGDQTFFRFLLPLAPAEADATATAWPSRPEFYDFDLFAARAGGQEMDDHPLSQLTFTVFDTETTGLDPTGGDEIIQIGAVRMVNGRILRGEHIDQLVDPQRSIPEAGIPIHHIHPHMVRGMPTIDVALPVLHSFAHDSVLVGHNIAFDMRFLKLKEELTGLRWDFPLLDTLLLSSVIHPDQESHSLEAIADRLGIQISARHTALGDALATAEVFQRLIPLLEQQGVRTLGQARAASGQSQFARLRY